MGGSSALKVPEEPVRASLGSKSEGSAQPSNRVDRLIQQDLQTELIQFVSAFEDRAKALLLGQHPFHKVSEALLLELRRLVLRETARLDLIEGFNLFTNKLRAEPAVVLAITELVSLLERGVEKAQTLSVLEIAESRTRTTELLTELLTWYASRKRISIVLEQALTKESGELFPFNFEILHNQTFDGVSGFEFTYSLSLLAQRGREYWAKLSVREPGDDVRCRKGWESWSDLSSVISKTETPRFASMVPIVANSNNALFEKVSHFVPYDALNLPAGDHRCKLQLVLLDETRTAVYKMSLPFSATISPLCDLSYPTKSPQYKECWNFDLASGNGISNLRISRRDTQIESLAINFDLALKATSLSFSGLGEYTVRCALVGNDGCPVKSSLPAFGVNGGDLILEFPICLTYPMQRFPYREISLPLAAIPQESLGDHLRAEVTVVDHLGRAVCGATSPLYVDMTPKSKSSSKYSISNPQVVRNEGVRIALSLFK